MSYTVFMAIRHRMQVFTLEGHPFIIEGVLVPWTGERTYIVHDADGTLITYDQPTVLAALITTKETLSL